MCIGCSFYIYKKEKMLAAMMENLAQDLSDADKCPGAWTTTQDKITSVTCAICPATVDGYVFGSGDQKCHSFEKAQKHRNTKQHKKAVQVL